MASLGGGAHGRPTAHACPACSRPWALRGSRRERSAAWVFWCRFCSWEDVREAPAPASEAPERESASWVHGVRLYERDAELVDSIEGYLVQGWSRGGAGVVVATPEHRGALRERLVERGHAHQLHEGGLVELDAATTLGLFMRGGSPDRTRFQETVGALAREVAAERPLYAFGEMVDVLWQDDNPRAALALEGLWAELQAQMPFSLLCGYGAGHLDAQGREAVCAAHDHLAA